jgi:hypothetical protein
MRTFATVLLALSMAVSRTVADPITDCRSAHDGDPSGHIECLENALRGQGEGPLSQSPAPALPDGATTTPTATIAPAPEAAVAAPPEVLPTGLGAEQVQARQRDAVEPTEQAATVRILNTHYNAAGLGVFTLADSQVWQETERAPERLRLQPGREYVARIERGKLGGYRLYVAGANWMYKVKRLR